VLGAVLYAPALEGELVWDDGIVQKDQMAAFQSLRDVFFPPKDIPQWGVIYYRPLVTLSYLADQKLFGRGASRGPHGTVIVCHLIATFFVWVLARQILRRQAWSGWGALAAASIFAVHPIHAESVAWITGRSDTVAAVFFLPAIIAALHYRDRGATWCLPLSAILYLCAILSKEVALSAFLVWPALFLLVPADEPATRARGSHPPSSGRPAPQETPPASSRNGTGRPASLLDRAHLKPSLWLTGLYAAVTALYFWLRYAAGVIETKPLDSDGGGLPGRAAGALAYYLTKLVVPPPQSAYPTEFPPLPAVIPVLVVALLLLLLGLWLWRRGTPLLLISLVWVLLTLLPSLVVAVRRIAETPIAERYLYIPSLGLSVLCGGLFGAGWSRRGWRIPTAVLGLAVASVYSYWTVGRVATWKDNVALWSDVTCKNPRAGLPWLSLGQAYMKRGNDPQAIECFDKALQTYQHAMGRALAWNSKGAVLMKDNPGEAAKCFQKALEEHPTYATPYFNLGLLAMAQANQGQAASKKPNVQMLNAAREFFSKAITFNRHYVWAYLELGKCEMRLAAAHLTNGEAEQARQTLLEARTHLWTVVRLDPAGRHGKEAAPLLAEVNRQLERPAP